MTDNGHAPGVLPAPQSRGAEQRSALYYDVGALLDDGIPDPPEPTVMRTAGGYALFYDGQVNLLFGDPESGKTWVALCGAAESLFAFRRVIVIDLDHNGPAATITRLLEMGVPPATLRSPAVFRYVEPEDRRHLLDVVADCRRWHPDVAVVDSVGELLPMLGLNSNSPDDFTAAHAQVLKPLAMSDAAVLAIDHLPKGAESRAVGPTGTAAKRRAVGGTSIRVTVKEQFAPGRGGSSYLSINKDRHGGLRRHCLAEGKEPSAGLFILDSRNDRITWRVTAPQSGEADQAIGISTADVDALAELTPAPKSQRDVQTRMGWGGTRALNALNAFRSRSAPGAENPPEQATITPPAESAPRSAPPVSGARSTCTVCREPMFDTGEGFTTHPNCGPAKPCGHPGKATANGKCGQCIAERNWGAA